MSEATEFKIGTTTVKKGLAQMLKGGVIVSHIQQIPFLDLLFDLILVLHMKVYIMVHLLQLSHNTHTSNYVTIPYN